MVIPFELPLPPSVNHMYVGRGRHKSAFYKAWLRESQAAMLLSCRDPRARGIGPGDHWQLAATCVMPNWRRRDLDNCLKPLVDFLAEYLGLEDNRLLAIAVVKAVAGGESYVAGEVTIG